jgi:hypothetical protein
MVRESDPFLKMQLSQKIHSEWVKMKRTFLQLGSPNAGGSRQPSEHVSRDANVSCADTTSAFVHFGSSPSSNTATTPIVKSSAPQRTAWGSASTSDGVVTRKREREYVEVFSSDSSPVLLCDDAAPISNEPLKLSAASLPLPSVTAPAENEEGDLHQSERRLSVEIATTDEHLGTETTQERFKQDSHEVQGNAEVKESDDSTPAVTLSDAQQFILDLVVKHQRSVFLTGGGGTGKSFLLREIIDHLDKRTTFVTAPTGIAALNVGGVTLHSFAGIGLGEGSREDLLGRVRGHKAAKLQWQGCRVLIIDEVSMVPKKMLDDLEYIARRVRGRDEPFGGIQLVLCGDFLQLPPVSKRGGRSSSQVNECDFCFASRAWERINPRVFILRTLFRQHSDTLFATILNELRLGQLSHDSIHTMMSISHSTRAAFVDTAVDGNIVITDDMGAQGEDRRGGRTVLRSTNSVVKNINDACFGELDAEVHSYVAVTGGPQPHLLDQCPAEGEVSLRVGARVMLLKNLDQRAGLVNGSIGVVSTFVDADQVSRDLLNPPNSRDWLRRITKSAMPKFPVVRFSVQRYSTHDRRLVPADRDLVVQPQSWTVLSGTRELAFRWQIPLKLAWAITIHKSQGMTLQNVNVDFDGMFEDAQAYVALSRCTTLQGLTIENFDLRKVRTNVHALAYYDDLEATIARSGGDCSMFTLPALAENPWGATQPSLEDDAPDVGPPTQAATAFNNAVSRIRERLPSAMIDAASRKRVRVHRPVAAMKNGSVQFTQGVNCGCHEVLLSDLVLPFSRVANCFVVVDTCSLIALHNHSKASIAIQRLCDENFVRVPQMVLSELDGLTKRRDQPQTAFAARRARDLVKDLLLDASVELQRSDHSVDPSTVFALGGDGTNFGDATDATTRKDNPILCYASYLQQTYKTPIVICTEDCLLGLRANACGFSSCSVSSGI